MKKAIIIATAAILLGGCVSKPTLVEYYPPATDAEQTAGRGALKTVDYRKPAGMITIFGFSLF
jgi:uncharacterized lipoprotein YajG